MKQPYSTSLWIILFLFSVAIFIVHYAVVGQAVYGDGIYYYAYTRSLYKDHDLNLKNEIGHHYNHKNNNASKEEPLGIVDKKPTKTGYVPNKYPIGPALFWIPGFLIGDIIANIAKIFHPTISTLGYSDYYQIPIGILNILYVVLGLYILSTFLKILFNSTIVNICIITLFLGTNLIYYGSWDVINSHSPPIENKYTRNKKR